MKLQPEDAQAPLLGAEGVILDLDGVLYRGDQVVPGATELILELQERGTRVVALTNHAGYSERRISKKLALMGVPLAPDRIVTSATVAARHCEQAFGEGSSLAVLGSEALHASLLRAGLRVVPLGEPADALVVGYTADLGVDLLNRAVATLLDGAALIGTNPDRLIPVGDGWIPETGPLVRYLEAATGTTPLMLGKPHALAFDLALERLGLPADSVVMIGDTLQTDVAGAAAAGMRCIWLNPGVVQADLPVRPTRIAADLQQALALLG